MAVVQMSDLDFNPRSREGSDPTGTSSYIIPDDFNPRSREGSDNCLGGIMVLVTTFQSTLP